MKTLIRVVVIVVVAIVVIAVALPFVIDVNQFRPRLEAELSGALGRPVAVGNLKLSVLSGSVEADDLKIADDPAFSPSPFLQAKSLSAGVNMTPLVFTRKIEINRIAIDQPEIVLLEKPSGEWNYSNLGGKNTAAPTTATGAPVDLSVSLVKISNGRLTIGKTGARAKPLVLDNVNVELKDFSRTTAMPFSLGAKVSGGGEIKIDGKAGPISSQNVELTPMQLTLKATHLDLVESSTLDPASPIAGIVDIDASGDSDGKRIDLEGKVKADKLKLVKGASPATRTAEFDFHLQHQLATRAGSLLKGEIHVGKAEAALTGTYSPQGDSMALKATLSGANMPLQELEGMLPALNIGLPAGAKIEGGTAAVKMTVEGPVADPAATGSVALNGVKLAGFDLGKRMATLEALAGIKSTPTTEIQTLSADVKDAGGTKTLDNIKLVVSNIGEITGSGTVSAAQALDFKMRVSVKGGMIPAALGTHAQVGVPFFIHGTASDPKFEPDVKGMAASEVNDLKGAASKAAGGVLGGLLGKKKQ